MFTQEVINAFEVGRTATAEIPATRLGHRAFVGVYPPLPAKQILQWRLRKFEISENLIDTWFGEEDIEDSQLVYLDTLQDVENLLSEWQLADIRFEAPSKNDWPL